MSSATVTTSRWPTRKKRHANGSRLPKRPAWSERFCLDQDFRIRTVSTKRGSQNDYATGKCASLSTHFAQETHYLGKLAQQGEFSELYYARARSIRRSGIPDWSLGFIQEGGGAFRDMGVHVLDSVWWLLGMP
jgi:hypothetical protein